MTSFDNVAEFYEALADSDARRNRERPFLQKWMNRAPGIRALDLACGSGFHSLLLAELGARVVAVDISPTMIAFAETRRGHPDITYRVQDMRAPANGPFDIAFCLGNSLSLLESPDDLRMTTENVYKVLAPAGLFVVQILNYALPTASQPRHRVERRQFEDREVIAVKSLVPHKDRTLLSLTFFSQEHGRYRSTADTGVLLHLSQSDLEKAAIAAQFREIQTFGGFDDAPFLPEQSPDLVMVMMKSSSAGGDHPRDHGHG